MKTIALRTMSRVQCVKITVIISVENLTITRDAPRFLHVGRLVLFEWELRQKKCTNNKMEEKLTASYYRLNE